MELVSVCVQAANAALQAAVTTHFPPLTSASGGQTETNNPVLIIQTHYRETIVQPLLSDTKELRDERQNAYLISLFMSE